MGFDWEDARDQLQEIRLSGERRPAFVLELGVPLLEKYSSSLDDEVWNVHEQVLIAALDCGRTDVAEKSLIALDKKFPLSKRVLKLRGMMHESEGKFEKAMEVYAKILKEDETNTAVRKRQIAVAKAMRDIPAAIDFLVKYLDVYMTDAEAWQELSELYLGEQLYTQAAFCLEELLLLRPSNQHHFIKYAEILYTIGGIENISLARKYYAKAFEIDENNTRALFGIKLTTQALQALGAKGSKIKFLDEIDQLVTQQIKGQYVLAPAPIRKVVQKIVSQAEF